jgi:hypothetical protein
MGRKCGIHGEMRNSYNIQKISLMGRDYFRARETER